MIKNVIFDFGQVLVRFEPEYMTSVYLKNNEDLKTVSKVVFDRLYWDRLDEGTISDDEIINSIKSRLPERLHEAAINAYNNWLFNLPEVKGMREVVMQLKENGVKLFLLSNISKQFVERYNEVDAITSLFSLFDGLVFSGPIGLVKPNKAIFEYILSKYSLNADECLFVDDNAANISGAACLGINTYLFDGDSKKLKDAIKTLF